MSRLPTRRSFLKAAAIGTAGAVLPVLNSGCAYAANEAIRVAVVGVNGRGGDHLRGFGSRVVAICDVDQAVLARRAGQLKHKVDMETDFRRLLDRKDIDAISIATPNHTHSWIAILAVMAGKDVYVEKPVSHNVWEGRQLANAARKYGRMVQCGTQSRSSSGLHQALAWLRAGNLGQIKYAWATCFKPRPSIGKRDQLLAIPKTVDYDLWCGPAAKVDLYRPHLHYDWHWDFNTGNGDLGNQGIHQMDIARWMLGETALSPRVMSIGGRVGYSDAGNTPNTQLVYHAYERAPLIFEVRGLPSSQAARNQKDWASSMDDYRGSRVGVVVQCEQGHLLIPSYVEAIAFGADGHQIKRFSGGSDRDHYDNFLAAVASRKAEDLNAEVLQGHLSSALCHTANISFQLGHFATKGEQMTAVSATPLAKEAFQRLAAHLDANKIDVDRGDIRLGRWLEMDGAAERFTNSDEANRLLTRQYRAPYVVPAIS